MLSFQEQQKILKPILEKQTNKHCADCGTHTPTWASLDFGVFVCSNCSGAHRALGPTITRIKSTKLDQWNKDWVQNMRLGNIQINQYWEADSKTATVKKPQAGASLDQHNRYVFDKYLKKKFVNDKNQIDPLKAYKTGRTQLPNGHIAAHSTQRPKNIYISQPEIEKPSIVAFPKKFSQPEVQKKQVFSLLDSDTQYPEQQPHQKHQNSQQNPNKHQLVQNGHTSTQNGRIAHQQQDQFTDYIQPAAHNSIPIIQNTQQHNTQIQQHKDTSNLSFDQLLKQSTQPKPPQHHHQHPQTMFNQQQWNNNQYNQPMNTYGYNMGHQQPPMYQPQSPFINQFAHNPYIGYAPHNSLHAAYNMNMSYNPY